MPTYNGLLCGPFTRGDSNTTLLNGTSFVSPVSSVPSKFFTHVELALTVTGISGGFTATVIGAVGGATYAIAQRNNITANGSYPIPLLVYGSSGNDPSVGIPRPYGVEFKSIPAGQSNIGFTASVYISGEY